MITSKQRAELRAAANSLEPTVQIGQGGLTENVILQVEMNLVSKELVKIDCLKNSDVDHMLTSHSSSLIKCLLNCFANF